MSPRGGVKWGATGYTHGAPQKGGIKGKAVDVEGRIQDTFVIE